MMEPKTRSVAEWQEEIRKMRLNSLRAAAQFCRACQSNDHDEVLRSADRLDDNVDAWRHAFRKVARLPWVSPVAQRAFLSIWVESKHIALEVGDRPTTAQVLRLFLPRNYMGKPMVLYRGTRVDEWKRRRFSFSWSQSRTIAKKFAIDHSTASESVLLETIAPPEAILHVRPRARSYNEREVIVDPYKLHNVHVIARFNHTSEESVSAVD